MLNRPDDDPLDATLIDPYIISSGSEIDTAFGGTYRVPITGEQSLIIVKGIAIGIALARLYEPNSDGNIPQRIRDDMDHARQHLKDYGGSEGQQPIKWLPDAPRQTKMARSTAISTGNYDGVL